MNLSHAYGHPPDEAQGIKVIEHAFELGVNHFDSAILYGFGRNEELVGKAVKPFRDEILLASKCGLTSPDLKRQVDGRPEMLKRACDESLQRLQTDVIDLYYLHRWDKSIPIEESMGAMKDLVEEGKIKSIGLCEVSAQTIRKAHAVHPIAAVQTEYSLWTRNPEIAVLDVCRELGAAFVAFSPLARGFLSGTLTNPPNFVEEDLRRNMPRFQEPHYSANLKLLNGFRALADEAGCTMSQLALAWLLHRGAHIIPIPGTTKTDHLEEDLAAVEVNLTPELMAQVGEWINQDTVSGPRYNEKTQKEIDTEEFG